MRKWWIVLLAVLWVAPVWADEVYELVDPQPEGVTALEDVKVRRTVNTPLVEEITLRAIDLRLQKIAQAINQSRTKISRFQRAIQQEQAQVKQLTELENNLRDIRSRALLEAEKAPIAKPAPTTPVETKPIGEVPPSS